MDPSNLTFPEDIVEDWAELDLASSIRDLLRYGWTRDEIKNRVDEIVNEEVGND